MPCPSPLLLPTLPPSCPVLQARRKGRLNAAFVAGAGYGSDDDGVYRAAAAVDAATGVTEGGYDSDDAADGAAARGRGDVEALAALQHDGIVYAPFNKDFYEVAPDVAAMSHAEVGAGPMKLGATTCSYLIDRRQTGWSRKLCCGRNPAA